MHDDQLRKSKLYRSLANARTANDANNRAALKQTIAISFTSADRARVGAIRKARVSNADYWHQRAGRASIGLHSTPSWKRWSKTCCPAMGEPELSLLCLCPTSFLRHRDSFATCCRYFTATGRFGTALRTLLKSVNQMFNFREFRLEMLVSLAKCLFKFGYEVHISS
jgi:hypothetical protein